MLFGQKLTDEGKSLLVLLDDYNLMKTKLNLTGPDTKSVGVVKCRKKD